MWLVCIGFDAVMQNHCDVSKDFAPEVPGATCFDLHEFRDTTVL